MWPQMRCRKAFGSSIADNMMCVSKKKKPIDATCNVGWGLKLKSNIKHQMLKIKKTETKTKDNMMCVFKKKKPIDATCNVIEPCTRVYHKTGLKCYCFLLLEMTNGTGFC